MNTLKLLANPRFGHKLIFPVILFLSSSCLGKISRQKKSTIRENGSAACCYKIIKDSIQAGFIQPLNNANGVYYYSNSQINLGEKGYLVTSGDSIILKSDSNDIFEWIDLVNRDSVRAYGIGILNKPYFLACSRIDQATGLAVNFYVWLVIDLSTGYFSIIWSLSNDPIFFVERNGDFLIYSFDYTPEYLDNHKNDNSLYVTEYKFNEGKITKIYQNSIECNCMAKKQRVKVNRK